MPSVVKLHGPYDYTQLLVTGQLDNGLSIDLSRMAKYTAAGEVAKVSLAGQVQAKKDGHGRPGDLRRRSGARRPRRRRGCQHERAGQLSFAT